MSLAKWNGGQIRKWNGIDYVEGANLAVGTILFYDGTGIANVSSRTTQIGDDVSDTITLQGWYVCNGQSSTPDYRDHFIRGETTSSDSSLGDDDAIVVSHGHTIPSQANHTHSLSSPTHTHTFPSSGYAWWNGATNVSQDASGNLYPNTTYSSAGGSHSHTMGSTDANHIHTIYDRGSSGVGANIPAYYSVIMIIRMS